LHRAVLPTREAIMTDVDDTVRPYLTEIRKLDPNAVIGYRGSLANGVKGAHKGGGAFDPSNFDVDIFIVSDKIAALSRLNGNFRSASYLPQVGRSEKSIEDRLRKNKNFSGLRDEELTFRIFKQQEIWKIEKKGEKLHYIMKSNAE